MAAILDDIDVLTEKMKKIDVDDKEAWRRWRFRNKKQYDAWAKSKYTCPHCKKKNVTRRKKYQHEKSKKCKKARGIPVPKKIRRVRSDKGRRKVKN